MHIDVIIYPCKNLCASVKVIFMFLCKHNLCIDHAHQEARIFFVQTNSASVFNLFFVCMKISASSCSLILMIIPKINASHVHKNILYSQCTQKYRQ